MTTATEHRAGLLRAICETPDDDGPRLVLADLLDETGEGERAEFIRVQCKLATMPGCTYCQRGECLPPCEGAALRRRERELLEAHWEPWLNAIGLPRDTLLANVDFRRGFVERVTLPLATFMGGLVRQPRRSMEQENVEYVSTRGLVDTLAGLVPLMGVTLIDREPLEVWPGVWCWSKRNHFDDAHAIPEALFRIIVGPRDDPYPERVDFDTRDAALAAALAALSAACVLLARRAARMPDLTEATP